MKERDLQKRIVKWFRTNYPNYVIFQVPNEATRTNSAGFKATGTLPGAPDLVLVLPYITIFLELKSPSGKLREEQKSFRDAVQALSHHYYTIRDLQDLKAILREHLYVDQWKDL